MTSSRIAALCDVRSDSAVFVSRIDFDVKSERRDKDEYQKECGY